MGTGLRYAALRWSSALRAALSESSGSLSLSSRLELVAVEASKPMTSVVRLSGDAMAPALGSDELLLVRSLAPPADAVWPGDVVTVEREGALLVRRVAALPGDEMESSVAGDEAFTVRDGYAWVVRDNESCHRAPDSRSFGEVPLDSVKGRVLYGLRSASDHGAVANSERARYNDAPVLAAELNVTALARHVKRDTTKP